jgi:hypothetical protein
MLPVLQGLSLGGVASPIGILSLLIIIALAIVVVRFVLKMAVRIAIIVGLVVGVLWFLGLLGPLGGLLGV